MSALTLSRPRRANLWGVSQVNVHPGVEVPEGDLLPTIASGDRSLFRELVRRYRGLVWSLAKRQCETEADAEDAAQDIFLDVWRSASRFDPSVASEVTFVAMIARRRLIDRRRRVSRRPSAAPMIEDPGVVAEPDPRVLTGDARTALAALKQLSEGQQRVLQLSLVHGLSHEKIAAATGMPLGTVKTHARRGLMKVRQLLSQERGES